MLENSWIGWGYYLLAAAGLFAVWWRMTMPLPWARLRLGLRAAVLALMVCPFSVGEGYVEMAPAVLMVAMETVFEGVDSFYRAGPTLVTAVVVVTVLALLLDQLFRHFLRKRDSSGEAV